MLLGSFALYFVLFNIDVTLSLFFIHNIACILFFTMIFANLFSASLTLVSLAAGKVCRAHPQVSSPVNIKALTSDASQSELFIGLGTRYGGSCTEEDCWQDGACSFVDYDLPNTVDGSTCVSEDIWNNGTNCGGCIEVSYKGTTITVMVRSLH
jgi:hypothetical protein